MMETISQLVELDRVKRIVFCGREGANYIWNNCGVILARKAKTPGTEFQGFMAPAAGLEPATQ